MVEGWKVSYTLTIARNGKKVKIIGGVMFEIEIPQNIILKQGHIDFMYIQLDAYKKKATKKPEFTKYVLEIEEEIKLMEAELTTKVTVSGTKQA